MTDAPSEILADGVVRALAACGVRDVVYCPGSRDAPLAYALARAEREGLLRAHVRLDERGAAFLAVGLSRAAGIGSAQAFAPVAVVTTSGGAVAELHAGVAEASHSGIPLIVVSADRPFELLGVGASQTTHQPGLFGSHVRDVWDVPADTPAGPSLDGIVTRAVSAALGVPSGRPGPVQINVGFRDPLVPLTWPGGPESEVAPVERSSASLPTRILSAEPVATPWEDALDPTLATVIVAGDGADPHAGEWAERAGVPLLAEPTSGATTSSAWVPHQQALLDTVLAEGIRQVLVTGRPTLSRPVTALLSRPDIRLIVHSPVPGWVDVAGRAELVAAALDPAPAPHPDVEWAQAWRRAGVAVDRAMRPMVVAAGDARPTLASVARAVWEDVEGTLLLGASLTIRAVDLVAGAPGRAAVVSNRGLAGIDGTIATALGLAWGGAGPVNALMGDLTFFHDASSLMLSDSNPEADVRIVVLDDHGGSIFSTLEHGRDRYVDVHERWFATPQNAHVEDLARAYGAAFRRVGTMGDLRAVLGEPVRGREIIHVPLESDASLLASVRGAGAAAV